MGYSETWKILEEIIIEFRKKNLPVSESVMKDLKSAKTLIKLMDTGEDRGEISPKVETFLANLEANLVTEAQKTFPPERIDGWLRRLEGSSSIECGSQPKPPAKEESRFVPGLPRDQKWVRVNPIASLPGEKLQQLAEESKLAWKKEKDGHLVVFGKTDDIREFVKKMTEQASR